MKHKHACLLLSVLFSVIVLRGQDTSRYALRLDLPFADLPQNVALPYTVPSMYQALEISNGFYELGFYGIESLSNRLFRHADEKGRTARWTRGVFNYGLDLLFSKYGSELPIPLGVWGHEEFHRSTLGVAGITSKNGNWLLNRWDGTVYGVSDDQLVKLKSEDPHQLLYSYVAGVQYEIVLNQRVSLHDFYKKRSHYKSALLLYNAHYVYNYFKFSCSVLSDSVKKLAPPHEHADPAQRDYAGADLTAWMYDMGQPLKPFSSRDSFPGGEGVNRRLGFLDLDKESQDFLVRQKRLSLINFLNPGIFFVNRVNFGKNFSMSLFAQYAPTHFGNSVAVFAPFRIKSYGLLIKAYQYNNRQQRGAGWDLA